jgi:uracil-DNA glycosylase
VPPANLPKPFEIGACNRFLAAEIGAMPRLKGVLALGGTAHNAVLRAHGIRPARAPFGHGMIHDLPGDRVLADSYHVSRLNTNTGRLTEAMFHAVVRDLLARTTIEAG